MASPWGLAWRRPRRSRRCAAVGFLFEGVEGVAPEALQVAAQLLEPARLDAIDATRALAPRAHQPGLVQHTEVLGDRGTRDVEPGREPADRQRSAAQALEDLAPRRIGQGLDGVCVSHD